MKQPFNPLHELTPAQTLKAIEREKVQLQSYSKVDEDALADKRDQEIIYADKYAWR